MRMGSRLRTFRRSSVGTTHGWRGRYWGFRPEIVAGILCYNGILLKVDHDPPSVGRLSGVSFGCRTIGDFGNHRRAAGVCESFESYWSGHLVILPLSRRPKPQEREPIRVLRLGFEPRSLPREAGMFHQIDNWCSGNGSPPIEGFRPVTQGILGGGIYKNRAHCRAGKYDSKEQTAAGV